MSALATEVVFKVYFESNHGEEIRLGGNIGSLGYFDPDRTIPLYTTVDQHPWWTTKGALELIGDPESIVYRFCLFSGGRFKRWEEIETRRLLDVSGVCVEGVGLTQSHFDIPQSHPEGIEDIDESVRQSPIYMQYTEKMKKFESENEDIISSDTVIIVGCTLPVKLVKKHDKWHVEHDIDHFLAFDMGFVQYEYVGIIRYDNKTIPFEDRAVVTRLLKEFHCHPVYVDDDLFELYYTHFCEHYLRLALAMHNVNPYAPLSDLLAYENTADLWIANNTILKLFSAKIIALYQYTYFIWIHGYELILLPSRMRRKIPSAKIGYFFPMTFPTVDNWLAIPKQEELLKGMLGANQIGFHTSKSTRHFMSACCRVLGFDYYSKSGKMCVNVDGNEVCITTIHKGIDIKPLYNYSNEPDFAKNVFKLRKEYGEMKTLVGGILHLDRRENVLEIRLTAYEHFMKVHPEWRNKLVFVIIGLLPAVITEKSLDNLNIMRTWITTMNERLNCEFIRLDERTNEQFLMQHRLVYFATVDVFLQSIHVFDTLKYALEYTVAACRRREFKLLKQNNGMIILNEMHTTSEVLTSALLLYTRSVDEFAEVLHNAVTITSTVRDNCLYNNMSYCYYHTATTWAFHMLCDLKSTVQVLGRPNLTYATSLGSQSFYKDLIGRMKPLDTEELYACYRATQSRLILINIDALPKLDSEQRLVLEKLCVDKKNIVFLVSSKSQKHMNEKYGRFIYTGLAAEYGYYFRWPVHKFSSDKLQLVTQSQPVTEWQCLMQNLDWSWHEPARNVMELFVKRNPRSYIETSQNTITWQYGDTDPEFGYMQSKDLEDCLMSILSAYSDEVDILHGTWNDKKYLQVHTKRVSKAHFLENILLTLRSIDVVTDFILAIGDDESDESLFIKANELDMPIVHHDKTAVFTTMIGKTKTEAKTCVDTISELVHILNRLARSSIKETKFYSTSDLSDLAYSKKAAHKKDRHSDSFSRYLKRKVAEKLKLKRIRSEDVVVRMHSKSAPERKLSEESLPVHQPSSPVEVTDVPVSPSAAQYVEPLKRDKQSTSMHEYLDQLGGEDNPLTF